MTNLWLHSAKEEREKKKTQHHKSRKPGSGTSDLFNPHPLDQHEVHLSWSHTERAGPTPEEEKGSTLQGAPGTGQPHTTDLPTRAGLQPSKMEDSSDESL